MGTEVEEKGNQERNSREGGRGRKKSLPLTPPPPRGTGILFISSFITLSMIPTVY